MTHNLPIPERVPFRGTHYVESSAYDRVVALLTERDAELEQERVQHAGCLTAAEGFVHETASPGDYGWSLAYQKTLDLRRAYDRLREAPKAARRPGFFARLFRR